MHPDRAGRQRSGEVTVFFHGYCRGAVSAHQNFSGIFFFIPRIKKKMAEFWLFSHNGIEIFLVFCLNRFLKRLLQTLGFTVYQL
jgi:hypothetical protein